MIRLNVYLILHRPIYVYMGKKVDGILKKYFLNNIIVSIMNITGVNN